MNLLDLGLRIYGGREYYGQDLGPVKGFEAVSGEITTSKNQTQLKIGSNGQFAYVPLKNKEHADASLFSINQFKATESFEGFAMADESIMSKEQFDAALLTNPLIETEIVRAISVKVGDTKLYAIAV
jgi:hypothetical protein